MTESKNKMNHEDKDDNFIIKNTSYETEDYYLGEVKTSGLELKYIPKDQKTPEICLAAVRNSGGALEFVPEELKKYINKTKPRIKR